MFIAQVSEFYDFEIYLTYISCKNSSKNVRAFQVNKSLGDPKIFDKNGIDRTKPQGMTTYLWSKNVTFQLLYIGHY